MRTKLTHALLTLGALAMFVTSALAADPGTKLADLSTSDQKAGSILAYPAYSSSATAGNTTNTRINITNTNPTNPIAVHLFFVDGSTCGIADSYICLTQNQTASFLASDIDPGVDGYILAVAVQGAKTTDPTPGLPQAFDWLIGDEYIKLASGHAASLGAYSVATNNGTVAGALLAGGSIATIYFGAGAGLYNALPRTVAVDNIPSRADGNDTLLILNRLSGNFATGVGSPGTIFGILYDDAENTFSYSFTPPACQYRNSYSDNFPRTTPRFTQLAPAGRSAWTRFWSATALDNSGIGGLAAEERPLFGAVINRNTNAATASNAFNGGHNLHTLTVTAATTAIAVPVFPPNC